MSGLLIETPLDIIKLALKQVGVLGVGQSALAEDFNDSFQHLNMMLAQWAVKRWMVFHLKDYSFVSTGATSYTIGPAGDFVVSPRPNRIEAAFIRQLLQTGPNQVDYPVQLIDARETYNNIALKSLVTFPSYLFYDNAYPTGVLHFWPNPNASIYEMHVSVKEPIAKFTSLAQHLTIPEEYHAALMYNLAVRLGGAYQQPLDQSTVALAKDALATIRTSNTQVPELQMPDNLVRPGVYNPYSDQFK